MGSMFSKKKNDAPPMTRVKGAKQKQSKNVGLLVLHNEPNKPDILNLKDAIQKLYPEGSILVKHEKIDKGEEREEKENILKWIEECLKKNYIVLICLLTDYNLSDLVSGTDFENHQKIIAYAFKSIADKFTDKPYPGFITVDVDYPTTATNIKEKFDDVAKLIRAGGRQNDSLEDKSDDEDKTDTEKES